MTNSKGLEPIYIPEYEVDNYNLALSNLTRALESLQELEVIMSSNKNPSKVAMEMYEASARSIMISVYGTVAMEGIGDFFGAIIRGIISIFAAIYNAILGFFGAATNSINNNIKALNRDLSEEATKTLFNEARKKLGRGYIELTDAQIREVATYNLNHYISFFEVKAGAKPPNDISRSHTLDGSEFDSSAYKLTAVRAREFFKAGQNLEKAYEKFMSVIEDLFMKATQAYETLDSQNQYTGPDLTQPLNDTLNKAVREFNTDCVKALDLKSCPYDLSLRFKKAKNINPATSVYSTDALTGGRIFVALGDPGEVYHYTSVEDLVVRSMLTKLPIPSEADIKIFLEGTDIMEDVAGYIKKNARSPKIELALDAVRSLNQRSRRDVKDDKFVSMNVPDKTEVRSFIRKLTNIVLDTGKMYQTMDKFYALHVTKTLSMHRKLFDLVVKYINEAKNN